MNWSTVRKFFAAWIGMMLGFVSAAAGVADQKGSLGSWVSQVQQDGSTLTVTLVLIPGVSAVLTLAVMWGYHEWDRTVPPGGPIPRRNYFITGCVLGVLVPYVFASFAGIPIELGPLTQLLDWVTGE